MHNPTTYSMSKNQKEKLSKIIKNNNLLLIEDGIYAYLSDSNNIPLSAMAPKGQFTRHIPQDTHLS